MDFAQKLKQIWLSKDLSQEEMAKEMGLKSQQVYGNLEKGLTKKISQEIIAYIDSNWDESMENTVKEGLAEYKRTAQKVIDNPADFLTHEVIKLKAIVQIILRSQAEILAEKRGETVSKILSELSKAVRDEISVSVSELKQGKG